VFVDAGDVKAVAAVDEVGDAVAGVEGVVQGGG
jgi:hypothetical protein